MPDFRPTSPRMKAMTTLKIPLRAVFYKEAGRWIAHCLEFDLMGDGATKEEALHQLNEAIGMQLEQFLRDRNAANLFSPADSELFRKFAAGRKSDVAVGELKVRVDSVEIEDVDAREYSDAESDCALV